MRGEGVSWLAQTPNFYNNKELKAPLIVIVINILINIIILINICTSSINIILIKTAITMMTVLRQMKRR